MPLFIQLKDSDRGPESQEKGVRQYEWSKSTFENLYSICTLYTYKYEISFSYYLMRRVVRRETNKVNYR